jgi:hypothetical protein
MWLQNIPAVATFEETVRNADMFQKQTVKIIPNHNLNCGKYLPNGSKYCVNIR